MTSTQKLALPGSDVFPVAQELLSQGQKVVFTVSGNSMWPLIRHNRDSVLLVPLAQSARIGDIVLLRVNAPYNRYILHRIHRIAGDHCVTLGDGVLAPDPPVPLSCIIGRVEKIHRGSRVIPCDGWPVRILFRLWGVLLPFRRMLLHGLRKAAGWRASVR